MPPKKKKSSMLGEFRALRVHIKRCIPAYAAGLMFLVLTNAGQIAIPRLMGEAVDIIGAGNGSEGRVDTLMLMIVGLALVVAIGRYGWRNFIIGSARRIEADLRKRLYDKLLTLSGSFYSRHKIGDLMARATNDLQSVRMVTGMALVAFVDGVFMTMVIVLTLFIHYGRLGLVLITPLPLVTVIALLLGRIIGPMFQRVQENFARISEHVQESIAGIRVFKSFVKERRTLSTFRDINADYDRANMALVRFWGMVFPAMGFIAGLTVLLLLYFGGLNVIDGRMTAGDFLAALSYLGMLLWPVMGAGWVVNMVQRGAASMRRINEIFSETPDITDAEDALSARPSGDIEIRNLSFAYQTDEGAQAILDGVRFKAFQGQTTGLLGRTGSGKTTLVKLIPRLLDPPEGTILIGNTDIRQLKRSTLRKAVAVVSQDVFLFSETIRANILFSRPDAGDEELEAVIDAAGLRSDLPFFPNGLDTQVGEKGIALSGGQKQRIAIARALIASPDILILDDALSAVDADTEERILDNLFTMRSGKTTLMISHRVSALARCSRSIVLEDGKISQQGTHKELMEIDGFYKEIAGLQQLEHIE